MLSIFQKSRNIQYGAIKKYKFVLNIAYAIGINAKKK